MEEPRNELPQDRWFWVWLTIFGLLLGTAPFIYWQGYRGLGIVCAIVGLGGLLVLIRDRLATPIWTLLKVLAVVMFLVLIGQVMGYDIINRQAIAPLGIVRIFVLIGCVFMAVLVVVLASRIQPKQSQPLGATPKEPSKLTIYSADYGAWKGTGESFDVAEFMRRIIAGNSLVHGPIENDSFTIDGKNYVPRDPLFGQPKRLQVTYSYNGEAQRTVRRTEHGRLTLPEDSGIDWLGSELNKARTEISKAKSRNYPRHVFTLEKAWPEGPATSSTVFLKNKVRMILTNHLDRDVCVWTPLWDSTEVQAEGSPPGSTIQLAQRGWEFDEWEEPEKICVTVPIGHSFRTYVALRPAIGRSISERMRTGDWIGTALLPAKIDGQLYEIPIEIGKKANRS